MPSRVSLEVCAELIQELHGIVSPENPGEQQMTRETWLHNAATVGRAAMLINRAAMMQEHRELNPEAIVGDFADAVGYNSTVSYSGFVAVSNPKILVKAPFVGIRTYLRPRTGDSEKVIMSLTTPRDIAGAGHYLALSPSPRPNLELFARTPESVAYPFKGPDQLEGYNQAIDYMAPVLAAVLEQWHARFDKPKAT